jgi:selenocysteine lyase/cysteine desulfurase
MYDLDAVRRSLPVLQQATYINCGTLGLTAEPVLAALHDALDRDERGGHWAIGKLAQEVTTARQRVAAFMGCSPDELTFTRNATDGVNYVAGSLTWNPGDEILISDQEHPAMLYPWFYQQQRRGLRVVLFHVDVDPALTLQNVERLITPRTRLIGASHVTCPTGTRLPVTEMCSLARSRGLLSLIDGAQALAHIPVNVKDIGADFYVGNGHKWLCAPKGTGFLYIRRELIADMWPPYVGGAASFSLEKGLELLPTAARFEYGSQNLATYAAIPAALDWLEGLGWQAIANHMCEMRTYLREQLARIPGIVMHSPEPWQHASALTSFTLPGHDARATANRLMTEHNIVTRPVPEINALRISTAYFNMQQDIDRFLAAL